MKRILNLLLVCLAVVAASFVTSCKPEPVKVSTVTITPASLSLKIGETAVLTASVAPEGAEYSTVEWSSGNESVATVAPDGTVTAVASGEAVITAVAGGISGTCTVAVEIPYEGHLAFVEGNGDVSSLVMTLGKEPVTKVVTFKYTLNNAAKENMTFGFKVDESRVSAYNSAYSAEATMLPESAYKLSASGFTLPSGASESSEVTLTVKSEGLETGSYVLPLIADKAEANDTDLVKYVAVTVREAFSAPEGANLDEQHHNWIFYLNTEEYDPRLVTDYIIIKNSIDPSVSATYFGIGGIVNLRKATIGFDSAVGRAVLTLGTDLNYVLENRMTYVMPVQDTGRKVCICIEGGETGVGFCNLTDEQIADFVGQVADVVDKYGLDGVNLYDRNSGYGISGSPEVNTTSYPKLIKSLREKLGDNKILTVVDYEEPTASFHDTEATGGIAVGEYIDYAWHGYNSNAERYQIVDPWNQELPSVSKTYLRQPIAGLDKTKYGVFNLPFHPLSFSVDEQNKQMDEWIAYLPNWENRIVVTADIITHIQGILEGAETNLFMSAYGVLAMGLMDFDMMNYAFYQHNLTLLPDGSTNYGKWKKDW